MFTGFLKSDMVLKYLSNERFSVFSFSLLIRSSLIICTRFLICDALVLFFDIERGGGDFLILI